MNRRRLPGWLLKARGILVVVPVALALAPVSAGSQVVFTGSQFAIGGSGLASPTGVAADGQGNVYIADQGNNRILAVAASGSVTGPPTTVLSGLSSPWGVAADWSGNVYVADTGNNRILMLPKTGAGLGVAVTVGSGFNGPKGVAVDLAGNLYVTDSGNNQVVELPFMGSGFGSPVVVASGFNNPTGLALDAAANLFVADTGNNRVVKQLHSAQGYLAEHNLSYGLKAPAGVSVDKSGNVYIADSGNGRVIELIWFAGANRYNSQSTVGSGFTSPQAVAEDWSGNLYVADTAVNQVVESVTTSVQFGAMSVGLAGSEITFNFMIGAGTTVGGVGIYTQGVSGADFVDAGSSSCTAQVYLVVTNCGVNVTFNPMGSGSRMGAVVVQGALGNSLSTAYLTGIGLEPQAAFLPGTRTILGSFLSGPAGVTVDGSGNLYISDTGNNRVVEVPWTGNGYGVQSTVPVSGLVSPMGMVVDGAGNLFVVSNGNDKVIELPWTGNSFGQPAKVGDGFYGPSDLAVDVKGNLYVSDTLDNNVFKLPWTGSQYSKSQWVGGYHKFPGGVAVDAAGNVYFANPYLNSVDQVPWDGVYFTIQRELKLPGISLPAALATDGNSNLYILDAGNNRVLMLPWNGVSFGAEITIASGFNAPQDMAVDSSGNLYVADTGNNQVVKISLSEPGALNFANTYLGSTSTDSPGNSVIEDIGNLPLIVESVSFPQDFPEGLGGAIPCAAGVIVSPGTSCDVSTDFTPTAASDLMSESVEIYDNNMGVAGAQQTLAMSGASQALGVQSILFPSISNLTYGSGSIPLTATTSSGLPVTYQVESGPGTLNRSGSAINVTAAGTIVIVASQPGGYGFSAATSITVNVTVAPAVLTITPANISATYGAVPPSFKYSISGFVLGQNATQTVTGSATISTGVNGNPGAGVYVLTAAQATLSAANYTFVFVTGTLTVSPAVLNVTATSISCLYGSGLQTLPWTLGGFLNGDDAGSVTGAPLMTSPGSAATSVGNFVITPSLGSLTASNYTFTFSPGRLTVTPAILTVAASNQSMTYGQGLPSFTYTISGFVTGDIAANAIQGTPAISARAGAQPAAGTYGILVSLGSLTSANYAFKFAPGQLFVGQAQLNVNPNNGTMVYGSKMPPLTYTLNGFVNGDVAFRSVSGVPSLATTATSQSSVGSFAIEAVIGSLVSNNYSFTFGSGVLTVGRAVLTVVPQAASMTYGGALPPFHYTLQGFVNADGTDAVQGSPLFVTTATSASAVGPYTITGSVGSLQAQNYSFNVLSSILQVGKAVLNVVPGNASKTYGETMPAPGYTLEGLVNGDGASAVTGTPLFRTVATQSSPVGAYAVSMQAGSMSAANYALTFGGGMLTVNRAILSVVPLPATMTYGGKLPPLTYSINGLVNGDGVGVVAGHPVVVSNATSLSHAGVYATTLTLGTLSASNYTFATADGQITVTRAIVTITPTSPSLTYGSGLPVFAYTLSGFVNSDGAEVVSGAPVFTTNVSATSPAGNYVLSASTGTMSAEDYAFMGGNANIAVGKAVLILTPASVQMTYGGQLPNFTYSLQGFVNGDSTQSLLGSPAFTTAALSSSPSGTYSLVMSAGSLAAANYRFVFVSGRVTISKAVLQIAPVSIATTYGDAVPAFTYTLAGLVNGDGPTVLSGFPGFKTEASATSHAGTYLLTASIGTMTAANYVFSFLTGEVVVAKAVLTISAESTSMTYGGANRGFSYSTQGLINRNDWRAVSGSPAFSTTANATSPAGTYSLAVSLGSLVSTDYTFTFVSGEVVINKAVVTIVPDKSAMTYGGALPLLTYTLTGLLNGDNATVASGTPTFKTNASPFASAGAYQVTAAAGTMTSQSYTFVGGKSEITVSKAVLTITPTSAAMTYGGAMPGFTYTLAGFVNGDGPGLVSGTPGFTTKASSLSRAGVYVVSATAGSMSSGNYAFVGGTGNLVVGKATLTISAVNTSMTYGGALRGFSYSTQGFVNGDNWRAMSGAPAYSTEASETSTAGSYPLNIAIGSLASSNYNFTFVSGEVVVNKAVLTISPVKAWMTYGGELPELAYTLTGFLNGDNATAVSGAPSFTTGASPLAQVGGYQVVAAAGSLVADNYTFVGGTGAIVISKALLTITPLPASMTYGGIPPAYQYQAAGFVNGDTSQAITGTAHFDTSATSASAVGTYPVTMNLVDLRASNYSFTSVSGAVTITPAILTVTPVAQSVTYGSTDGPLTYKISGFMKGESQSTSTTGAPILMSAATSSSSVGGYSITAVQGTLAAENYTFQFDSGTVSVTQATLTATAANLSMTMGAAVPGLTYALSGLVNGDTAASATAGAATLTTSATATSAAGSYPITITTGSLASTNYRFTFVNGTLTISQ